MIQRGLKNQTALTIMMPIDVIYIRNDVDGWIRCSSTDADAKLISNTIFTSWENTRMMPDPLMYARTEHAQAMLPITLSQKISDLLSGKEGRQ